MNWRTQPPQVVSFEAKLNERIQCLSSAVYRPAKMQRSMPDLVAHRKALRWLDASQEHGFGSFQMPIQNGQTVAEQETLPDQHVAPAENQGTECISGGFRDRTIPNPIRAGGEQAVNGAFTHLQISAQAGILVAVPDLPSSSSSFRAFVRDLTRYFAKDKGNDSSFLFATRTGRLGPQGQWV